MERINRVCWALLTALLVTAHPVSADVEALPEPLTLEYALSLAPEHPVVELTASKLALQRAEQDVSDASAAASTAQRTPWPDDPEAARIEVEAHEWLVANTRARHRLRIMRRFFDVLLVDLRFARDDEAMAIAFVGLERARDQNELGKVSDIELLAAENSYQEARSLRYASEAAQRSSRSRLANALNRPGRLPATLSEPRPISGRNRPPFEELVSTALAENLHLKGLRRHIEAAERRIRAMTIYEPSLPRDAALAEAELTRRRAERDILRARLARHQLRVRQALLESWLSLGTLVARRDSAEVRTDYRDVYLDRSRALYEHEVRTDLGDAMVQTSAARLRSAKVNYDAALAWERIDMLTGAASASSGNQ